MAPELRHRLGIGTSLRKKKKDNSNENTYLEAKNALWNSSGLWQPSDCRLNKLPGVSAARFRRGSPGVEQNVDAGICVRGKNGRLLKSSTSAQPMHTPVPVHTYCDVPKEGHSTQQIKVGSAGVPYFPPTFCAVLDLVGKRTAYNRETSGNSTKKSTDTPGTCPWSGRRAKKPEEQ